MKRLIYLFGFFYCVFSFGQQTDYVDFKTIQASLRFVPDSSRVKGVVYSEFKILKDVDSVFLDAVDMDFTFPEVSKNEIRFNSDDSKIWFKSSFKKGNTYSVVFNYEAVPKKTLYFLKRNNNWNIWTQGQGKYTSHWLPSIDDVNDKIEFDIWINFDENYSVLSNGKFVGKDNQLHVYDSKKPMSSYLVALAIGKYNVKKKTSKSGIPLEYYYYPEDSLKVEPTYRYSKHMFDFLENEIGFDYPWQNYKQVPVHDFLYAGMENTSLTIFSDAFVVDSIGFNDRNYINVNAHELAHQWFGDLVTATSGEHHWLQEGFATYYALLAERDVFGKDYFDFKLYNSAQDLARQDLTGGGTSLLNPKSSSLTFYQRGAWVLYALRQKVGGVVFKQAVVNYLEKHQFKNAQTSDFIGAVEQVFGKSLKGFIEKWIVGKEFPFNDAIELLKANSPFIQEYIMVDCEANSSKCEDYIRYYVSDDAKVKVIAQRPDLVSKATFKESWKVRQAISQYVTSISADLKSDYESLLNDTSYLTIESALYNLWVNFPSERSKYLSKTRNIYGFNDKNVRLLWLVLNLNTPEYQTDKTKELLNELKSYTEAQNNFELRMNAFKYLELINACGAGCKQSLEQTKTHHNWRMVKFGKDMLKRLNKNQQ